MSDPTPIASAPPTVSVVVANYNGAAHIEACLASLLRQTLREIEVIVVDDGSTDDSIERVTVIAAADPRVVLLRNQGRKGPAGARNTALAAARGEWIAVVDSDDLVYARRFEQLIELADRDAADIVADDLLLFDNDAWTSRRFLRGARRAGPSWVTPQAYLDENHMFSAAPNLGFLKPLIRRRVLDGIRYDESLRIAEDFDLIMRLLLRGARFRLHPQPTYLYRKHSSSISYVLRLPDIETMTASHMALVAANPGMPAELARAFGRRRRALERAAAFTRLVEALKQKRLGEALGVAARDPAAALLLRLPALAQLHRLAPAQRPKPRSQAPRCCLVSRQRIIGPTNGSSTYLLAIARAIRELGVEVHLLQPSPSLMGRWPVLAFRPEMGVFASVRIRGTLALGRFRITLDPRVFVAATLTVLGSLAGRLGWRPGWLQVRPAPYAIGAPWTGDDLTFVARHAPGVSDLVVFDYAFQTVASPYILRHEPVRFTVMHDLFSSRGDQFAATGGADSVDGLKDSEERALLGGGDVTIAIQKDEAAYVARVLPGHRVLTSMMPVEPLAAAQPGDGETLLFVGSSAAPNVDGLAWFVAQVWPLVLAQRPDARLLVAGSVGRTLEAAAPNVQCLGVVPDLAPLYRRAGVVISPLRAGSGLKIKLIEALAQGKAVVATPTTLQGVAEEVGDAVMVAEQPAPFAAAVLSLLADPELRRRYAERALQTAADRFSAKACMGGLQAAVSEALGRNQPPAMSDQAGRRRAKA